MTESKVVAWLALVLVVVLIVLAFLLGTPWWGFIAIFFAFIAAFSHMASLYLRKVNRYASGRLENCALVSGILAVIGLIAVYIISNVQAGL